MDFPIRIIALLITLLINNTSFALERVPGTKISIDPPEGFIPSTRFSGYSHEETASSIMINELPAPFAEITKGFTKQALSRQGMSLLKMNEAMIGPHRALLYLVKQKVAVGTFLKWILVFGDDKNTEMVIALFPERAPTEWSELLKETLLASHWHQDLTTNIFEGLPYRIQEQGDLKIAKKISTSLLITRNGVLPNKPNSEPKVIIGPSFKADWQEPEDKLTYTINRLKQMTNLCRSPDITSKNSVSYDSLDGHQIEASCKHVSTGEQLYLLHAMIYSEQGYYLFSGIVNDLEKDAYRPVFEKIFRSFKRL